MSSMELLMENDYGVLQVFLVCFNFYLFQTHKVFGEPNLAF